MAQNAQLSNKYSRSHMLAAYHERISPGQKRKKIALFA
jgi:hypothetical protein